MGDTIRIFLALACIIMALTWAVIGSVGVGNWYVNRELLAWTFAGVTALVLLFCAAHSLARREGE
jgi:hypothetical protein